MKRFTILGIDLVSQTNKLKKHRIIGLFKTTTNKILDKINGKRRVHFEQISHRSRPSINRANCCRLASTITALSMISKRNLKQVTFKLELSNLLSVILLSSLSKLRIFSPPNKAAWMRTKHCPYCTTQALLHVVRFSTLGWMHYSVIKHLVLLLLLLYYSVVCNLHFLG